MPSYFENRLRFDKVTESLQVGPFFETQCIIAARVGQHERAGFALAVPVSQCQSCDSGRSSHNARSVGLRI